jgi:NitT/TauT family transport system ATP-binding protein
MRVFSILIEEGSPLQTLRLARSVPQTQQVPVSLSFEAVDLTYRRGETTIHALDHLSLAVPTSQFVAVVGPSGCGKSTLLHLAAGILQPSGGTVRLFDQPVRGIAEGIGYLLQGDGLLPWKTVAENVGLPLRLKRRPESEMRERVADWLARTGLSRFGDAYPTQLSGGMRKRAALAATLIDQPNLVLMDEPFSALDVQTRTLIGNELMNLWQSQRNTVLLVTHDLEEAIGLADRVIVLSARPARVRTVYQIDLPRPRDLTLLRMTAAFQELYTAIWADLREEVLRSYVAQ